MFAERPSDLTEGEGLAKQLEELGATDAARIVRRLVYRVRLGQHAPAVHFVSDLNGTASAACGKRRGSIELTERLEHVTCRNCQGVLTWTVEP